MKTVLTAVGVLALVAGAANADVLNRVDTAYNLADGVMTPIGEVASIRANSRAITTNDTYQAILLGQTTTAAGFVTNAAGRTTTFTYDGVDQVHGTLVGSNATVRTFEGSTQLAPNVLRVAVGMYTADSSSLWVNGITISGSPMTQGRIDVGGPVAGFTDGLLWDNLPGPIANVTIFSAVFGDGTLLASSSALTNARTLPEMGSLVVWNGVVGSIVDEIWMVFDIEYVIPTPGAMAVLGLGGLVAGRRRR